MPYRGIVPDREATARIDHDRAPQARAKAADDHRRVLAFTDTRPEEERWELMRGSVGLEPLSNRLPPMIVSNIVAYLIAHKTRTRVRMASHAGGRHGVPVSPRSLPQPDVFVKDRSCRLAARRPTMHSSCSRSLEEQYQGRSGLAASRLCQRAELPALCDRLSQGAEVVAYDRASNWHERTVAGLDEPGVAGARPGNSCRRYLSLDPAGAERHAMTKPKWDIRYEAARGEGRGLGALRSHARENRDGQRHALSTEGTARRCSRFCSKTSADAPFARRPRLWRAAVAAQAANPARCPIRKGALATPLLAGGGFRRMRSAG